ncbi:MAG: hypothetical protein IJH91_06865 [Mogibacterium sp.]|nr:hypothetical protein [Mogibacterium sp.]
MQVTFDIKQLLIILLLIAAIAVLITLVIVLKNLVPTLKKLDSVMDDAKRITTVAANKTEQIDGAIDNAGSKVLNIADNIKGGGNLLSSATKISAGLASAKAIAGKVRPDDDKEYLKRARERKASQTKAQ